MKRILFHVAVVFSFVLLLPFAVLSTILYIYSRLVFFLMRKSSDYVRGAAKVPKWFDYFTDYLVYITDFKR